MPTVDYQPIANGVGANVESQAQYLIDLGGGGSLATGYVAGLAKSAQVNKTLRQSSMISAAVAQFISNLLSVNVLDDGNVTALTANLTAAIAAEAIAAVTGGSVIVGQGNVQLVYTSATVLTLLPHNGNSLIVNGANQSIPAAGLPFISTITAPALSINTVYNLYCKQFAGTVSNAANNGSGLVRLTVNSTTDLATNYPLTVSGVGGTVEANGAWLVTVVDSTHLDLQGSTFVNAYTSGGALSGPVLSASTTAHARATNGTEVKSGDATQALVGKFRTNGSTQFVSSSSNLSVRSWFNDAGFALQNATSSNFLSWGENAQGTAIASITTAGAGSGTLTYQIDGGNVGLAAAFSISTGDTTIIASPWAGAVTEGYHSYGASATQAGGATDTLIGITISSAGRAV